MIPLLLCLLLDRAQPQPQNIIVESSVGKDGSGLCVNACVETLSRRQRISTLVGFHGWSRSFDGGSYPEKFEEQLSQFCRECRCPPPYYVSREDVPWNVVLKELDARPCVISVSGCLPQYNQEVITTVVLTKRTRGLIWIIDPIFPELGEFTLSVDELQKCYSKYPWVIFLLKNRNEQIDLLNRIRLK